MTDDTRARHGARQWAPVAILTTIILGGVLARLVEATQIPYSFPKGPAAVFYTGALILGLAWVLLCLLHLGFGLALEFLRKRAGSTAVWDLELDGAGFSCDFVDEE